MTYCSLAKSMFNIFTEYASLADDLLWHPCQTPSRIQQLPCFICNLLFLALSVHYASLKLPNCLGLTQKSVVMNLISFDQSHQIDFYFIFNRQKTSIILIASNGSKLRSFITGCCQCQVVEDQNKNRNRSRPFGPILPFNKNMADYFIAPYHFPELTPYPWYFKAHQSV